MNTLGSTISCILTNNLTYPTQINNGNSPMEFLQYKNKQIHNFARLFVQHQPRMLYILSRLNNVLFFTDKCYVVLKKMYLGLFDPYILGSVKRKKNHNRNNKTIKFIKTRHFLQHFPS